MNIKKALAIVCKYRTNDEPDTGFTVSTTQQRTELTRALIYAFENNANIYISTIK